jgi:glycosyltransferase involved in cell wall biosynthesis
MASERPVVAAAHGGPMDIVIPQETGLLFNPGDADSLADALISLIKAPEQRRAMGVKGRQRILDEFTLAAFNERFTLFYSGFFSTDYVSSKRLTRLKRQ